MPTHFTREKRKEARVNFLGSKYGVFSKIYVPILGIYSFLLYICRAIAMVRDAKNQVMENYFEELFCSLFAEFLMKIDNAGISCGEYYADCLTIQAMANRGYTEEELASRLSLSNFELRRALDRDEWLEKLLK